MLKINFVTTNPHKFAVAQHFFKEAGLLDSKVDLRQHDVETPEIQNDYVNKIALESARWVAEKLGEPAVVADAGVYINAINGFPGPYVKYANDTLEPEKLLALMENEQDRSAAFTDALAYYDPHTDTGKVFRSVTMGRIAAEPSIADGSTIDRLFIPEGYEVPLADIPPEDRVAVWNTDRWQELTDFLSSLR